MRYVAVTILLGFISFFNFMIAVVFNKIFSVIRPNIYHASNITNVSAKTMPLIDNLQTLFWVLCLFFAVATIVWYILGSHEEEPEVYSSFRERRY